MDKLEELKRKLAAKKAAPAAPSTVEVQSAATQPEVPLPPLLEVPLLTEFIPDPMIKPRYRDDTPITHLSAAGFVSRFLSGTDSRSRPGYVVLGPDSARKLVDIDEAYEAKGELGSGVYGTVFAGAAIGPDGTTTNQPLRALKQIKGEWLSQSQVGIPAYLLREFDVLMRLRHPNVVRGLQMGHAKGEKNGEVSVYLVSDHGGTNLKSFLYAREAYLHLGSRNVHPLAPQALLSKLKCVCKQLLEGLAYLHTHCVVHRDLKTSNLLVDDAGVVRICDFGLARFLQEGVMLTPGVCTLMYRAPELHFGIPDYGTKVDVWSAACIMAELFLKAPLFPSDTELQHFQVVCDILGVPQDKTDFKGLYHLPHAVNMLKGLQRRRGGFSGLGDVFKRSNMRGARECADSGFLDLIGSMLKWNPADRPKATNLLEHPWFTTNPLPCAPAELLWPLPYSKGDGGSPTHAPAVVASPLLLGKKRERLEGGGDSTPEGADGDEACAGAAEGTPKADQDDKRRLMAHYQDESAEPPGTTADE